MMMWPLKPSPQAIAKLKLKPYTKRYTRRMMMWPLPSKPSPQAIAKLKESKELLDLELLSQEEYDEIKIELTPIIRGNN